VTAAQNLRHSSHEPTEKAARTLNKIGRLYSSNARFRLNSRLNKLRVRSSPRGPVRSLVRVKGVAANCWDPAVAVGRLGVPPRAVSTAQIRCPSLYKDTSGS